MPVYYCAGNHEVDDQRVSAEKAFATDDSKWSWSIYMQLFRPLYSKQEYGVGGCRWYSVDTSGSSCICWCTWVKTG
jgi:hypothetical protein